jgi:hypothetical protein
MLIGSAGTKGFATQEASYQSPAELRCACLGQAFIFRRVSVLPTRVPAYLINEVHELKQ